MYLEKQTRIKKINTTNNQREQKIKMGKNKQ